MSVVPKIIGKHIGMLNSESNKSSDSDTGYSTCATALKVQFQYICMNFFLDMFNKLFISYCRLVLKEIHLTLFQALLSFSGDACARNLGKDFIHTLPVLGTFLILTLFSCHLKIYNGAGFLML